MKIIKGTRSQKQGEIIMKLKKWVKWTVGSVAVASGIVWGAYSITGWVMGNVESYEQKNAQAEEIEVTGTGFGSETITVNDDVEVIEIGGYDVDQTWSDDMVQKLIHWMSHDKVIADQKRGDVDMTTLNIQTMSQIIDENKDNLENYDVYRYIMDKWIAGDFSTADDDHNVIWEMQGGEVGQATGVMDYTE
jgi:hypothetical protein